MSMLMLVREFSVRLPTRHHWMATLKAMSRFEYLIVEHLESHLSAGGEKATSKTGYVTRVTQKGGDV